MTEQTILQQFGAQASDYVNSDTHARGASLVRLVELVQPQAHWQALDIATGAGHTAIAFAPHVAHVRATDITPQMMDQARQLISERGLNNITVEKADAQSLPYEDNTFHLVTCRIAPHHFSDIPRFIRESARVLRPGGLLAVVDNIVPPGSAGDYVNAFEKLRDPSHGRCLTLQEWIAAFQAANLTIEHQETLPKTVNFQFWAKRHDPVMGSYLHSMLFETAGQSATFLNPQQSTQGLTFQLLEALTITSKPS